jgi:membrane fusion protein (multidrug efflux system)
MTSRSLTLVLSIAMLAVAGCKRSPAEVPTTASTPVPVHVAEAAGKERPVALVLDGTLLADEESNVTSIVSGRIVAVAVERGAKVEAGDELIRLRDVDFKLQAKLARAQLAEARARLGMRGDGGKVPSADALPEVALAKSQLELANNDLARAEKLAADGVLSAAELDTLRTNASAAKDRYQTARNAARASVTALQGAQASLEQALTSAEETTIRAPFAGEIATRMVSLGEYVTPQTALVTLVRTDPLRIELSVPQQHLQDVQPGQRVSLVVDAIPGRKFDATVRYVSAAVERNTRSLTVEAVVPNDDGVLRPGLFATARLQTGAAQRVVEVPVAAVRTSAGVSRVYVVQGGVITERVLSIVERGQSTVTVAEGLDGDEQVAIDAFDQLGDGVAVNVLSAE